MMLYGPPGVGKTWLTHTLALMAAHGKPASIADNLISAGDAPPVKVLTIKTAKSFSQI